MFSLKLLSGYRPLTHMLQKYNFSNLVKRIDSLKTIIIVIYVVCTVNFKYKYNIHFYAASLREKIMLVKILLRPDSMLHSNGTEILY